MLKDYSKLSKEDLLKLIEKQEEELKSKKYGLVWDAEREPEQVVLDCENNLPVLKRVKGKEIRTNDEHDNILIEGDNYHALTVLSYTHKEKIDVIYIDPPYNTGNKDFIYNDKYVDREDGYRHSKWLNFMEKRLNLAKDLLKQTGVIFISIDDNEVAQLKLLCSKCFGEDNFVACVNVYSNPRGRQSSKYIIETHEYILVFAKNISKLEIIGDNLTEEQKKDYNKKDEVGIYREIGLRLRGGRATAEESPTLHFPIYVNPVNDSIYLEKKSGFVEIIPKFTNGVLGTWRWSKNKIVKDIDMLLARKVRRGDISEYDIFQKDYLMDDKTRKIKSSWIEKEINYDRSSQEQKDILGKKMFDYAKPVYLLEKIIKMSSLKKATILDFMAGTGTTGHAVLKMNKEDGGNRQFILCTNNENDICEYVTYPRVEKVISGYKNPKGEKVDGLGGNLQYFKTALIKKAKNKDQVRVDLTQKCTEMLCVKENIFNLGKETEDFKIFSANKKDKFLCVYYNFLEDSFDAFLKELKKLKGKKVIYMFSMDGKVDSGLFSEIDNFEIEEIPQKIIDIYKQLAKMNIPVKADLIFSDFEKAKGRIFTDKEKDDGARILRIVIEKVIQKIAQNNGVSILKNNSKDEKLTILNDKLKSENFFSKVDWEENKTYIAIGNHAAHGEYSEYDLKNAENFYRHIQKLIDRHNIQ